MVVVFQELPVPPVPPVPLPPTPPPDFPGGLDPNFLISQLVPFFVFVAAVVLGGLVLRWFFRSPIAEAFAERIRARTHRRFGQSGGTVGMEGERGSTLEQHVTTLQGQLAELAERVDFAERLLAERRERKLSAGQ